MSVNNKRLLLKSNESADILAAIEKSIHSIRNYIFKVPPKNHNVILLLSGGIDSVVAWEMLMGKYMLNVYPLFVKTAFIDKQLYSIRYFSKYFKNKYPKHYHEPYIVPSKLFDGHFSRKLKNNRNIQSDIFFKHYNHQFKSVILPFSGQNILSAYAAISYLKYLEWINNINIKTIIYAVNASDGTYVSTQTLTYMRLTMLMMLLYTNEKNLQFGSIFYEPHLSTNMDKSAVIQYGLSCGLPLNKTYSCYKNTLFHCGRCLSCISRKYNFHINKYSDQTVYTDSYISNLRNKLKSLFIEFLTLLNNS